MPPSGCRLIRKFEDKSRPDDLLLLLYSGVVRKMCVRAEFRLRVNKFDTFPVVGSFVETLTESDSSIFF